MHGTGTTTWMMRRRMRHRRVVVVIVRIAIIAPTTTGTITYHVICITSSICTRDTCTTGQWTDKSPKSSVHAYTSMDIDYSIVHCSVWG